MQLFGCKFLVRSLHDKSIGAGFDLVLSLPLQTVVKAFVLHFLFYLSLAKCLVN